MKWRGAAYTLMLFCVYASYVFAGEKVTEEFHQTYPLIAGGELRLKNINGDVNVSVWGRAEVRVDAMKTARSKEDLEEMEIVIRADERLIHIETEYDSRWDHDEDHGSVDYRLTVPRAVTLRNLSLVNGNLEIAGVEGNVDASCVNGEMKATGLAGEVELSNVNGSLEATFERISAKNKISLGSVNGKIVLSVPSDSDARFHATTVLGNIRNDFGFEEDDKFMGEEVNGSLGEGKARVKLSNVNGTIQIRKLR